MSASDSVLDPVCGMPADPKSALRVDRNERTYFFCSALCRDAFLKNAKSHMWPDGGPAERRVAYFTMEVALEPAMPTYAGGLGVLAGDTIRSCADLRVPLVAVTLLTRDGYFTQTLSREGQREEPARWKPEEFLQQLPATVEIVIEGRRVVVRAWEREVIGESGFRVPVVFLDTNMPENDAFDRSLSGTLYGGDERYRLCQEVVLGIGGVRVLAALGYEGLRCIHLNEGHAALAPLELLRRHGADRPVSDWPFAVVRGECVFTTHTPVRAGHDQFPRGLVTSVLGSLVPSEVMDMLGCGERLNMTTLALNTCGYVNGVARSHANVSREMFPGYAIEHVTNGVHPTTWTSAPFSNLFDEFLPGWKSDPFLLRNAGAIPLGRIWDAHEQQKRSLLATVRQLTGRALDPERMTIGFARRATLYKRTDLVFSDLRRLRDAAARGGPLQFVFAGKAHPQDVPGKALIRRVLECADELGEEIPVVYLPNYDMALAKQLVAGVDLWLNTPQRPLEASGTSGMKAAHNGVPSFSVLDGWWLEGHIEGVTGWSIGRHPLAVGKAEGGACDADDLYAKLAFVIGPMFAHTRERWVAVMRNAISLNASFFHTHRMVQQYVTNAYI